MTYIPGSRRDFLKNLTATSMLSATAIPVFGNSLGIIENTNTGSGTNDLLATSETDIPGFYDGPQSTLFKEILFNGNSDLSSVKDLVSPGMAEAVQYAPAGHGTAWGIPFHIPDKLLFIKDQSFEQQVSPFSAKWLVFLHTSDQIPIEPGKQNQAESSFKGIGYLNEHIADYFIVYSDGTEAKAEIRERHHIGMFRQIWGENNIQSVAAHKPVPQRAHHEQMTWGWGSSQTRVSASDRGQWINWIWAWENPNPEKQITGFRFVPLNKVSFIISAISCGMVSSNPFRWQERQKAILTLPGTTRFDPTLSGEGLLTQVQLDLGQVISASPRFIYPDHEWGIGYNNKTPVLSENEILVEYTAHPEAQFHLADGVKIPVAEVLGQVSENILKFIPPASQKVRIRILEKGTGKQVAVKLHVHGAAGEYLAPMDRHRIPNTAWFEDYSVDFVNNRTHICTYISGETLIKLPIGKVYIEISKGFEIKPVRKEIFITPDTEEITLEIEKFLPWREKGWVSADTHVHFLSPNSALLEGAGEGVNIVNLLSSQWGELFTNIGDFDGKTTFGSREAGGDGEYLVRVGTENRKHILGHISLLGYKGNIITPITTGGADESALGDPVDILLTEWAEQCKNQDGVVILPHFPNPRLEHAAAIIKGTIDGVEMTSWGDLYSGIDPYSLADWYRYLNCGYFIAAVGGTDKMGANTAVGTVRTYARISNDREFTYDEWKKSIRKGETFVTYGPLLNFSVDGKPMGSRIQMSSGGGTVDISWEVASVTIPMTRVELIVNGEIRESLAVAPDKAEGHWNVKVNKSSWYALLVRGHYPDKPEIITAHSSPVMINVDGSQLLAAADAVTILDQIEGALAYIDTIGIKAEDKIYKRMRLVLESTHRALHNRMHQMGQYHRHSPLTDHPEDHRTG